MEPWELTDAQFWGELDAALLMADFQASEQAESIARFRAWAGRPPTPRELGVWQRQERVMSALAESLERLTAALTEQIAPLRAWMKKWSADPKEADQPRPRRGQPRPTPRTLHAALAVNVRAVPRLPARPVRSPATRRY